MTSEYVRVSTEEKISGEKDLLESQLKMLNSVKFSEKFLELRNQELSLKVALKSKIEQTLSTLKEFERTLPKASPLPSNLDVLPILGKEATRIEERHPKETLEEELRDIKNRLAKLSE